MRAAFSSCLDITWQGVISTSEPLVSAAVLYDGSDNSNVTIRDGSGALVVSWAAEAAFATLNARSPLELFEYIISFYVVIHSH